MGEELILVADDFERGGIEALLQGDVWAARVGGRLAVCHAVPELGALEGLLGLVGRDSHAACDAALTSARASLEYHAERVLDRRADSYHVAMGTPHRVVLDLARELGATLIVLGRGRNLPTWGEWLGSSADQVVRHAEVPVLVARPSPASNVVLAASDLSDPALPAIMAAAAESRRRHAKLVVSHALALPHPVLASFDPSSVLDEGTAAALREACHRTLAASAERFDAKARTEVADGRAARAIPDLARRLEAELLVVGTHGRSGDFRVALGSTALAIIRRAPCSVLVVRASSP
jgi:nucleotide-binding universal stress UspA family protein